MDFLTEEKLKQIIPKNKHINEWYELLDVVLPIYHINTVDRVTAFISQCSHESRGFTALVENLNYSASALNKVFPKYFKRAGRNADDYHRNQEAIANVVYANRMGNGDIDSGDGWKFRGRGVIQLTGTNNYKEFGTSMGMDLDNTVNYLMTFEGALQGACWFWNVNKINRYADACDVKGMTRKINGGTNGLKHRTSLYQDIHEILN